MPAVYPAVLKPGSRRGPVWKAGGGWSYYETWIVRTTKANERGAVVLTSNGLPRIGSGYPNDALALCTEIDPQQTEHAKVWHVQLRYEKVPAGKKKEPTRPDDITPDNYPPRRSWSSIPYEVFPLTDREGKKFANSAGDPIDPSPVQYKYHPVLSIEQYKLKFDAAQADEYHNTVNEDVVSVDGMDYPAFSARLTQYHGTQHFFDGGDSYWQILIVLEFNPELWHPHKEVDRGPRHKILGKKGIFLHRDTNGVLTGRQMFLDGNGYLLPVTSDNPILLEFKLYDIKAFKPLNLPLD